MVARNGIKNIRRPCVYSNMGTSGSTAAEPTSPTSTKIDDRGRPRLSHGSLVHCLRVLAKGSILFFPAFRVQ